MEIEELEGRAVEVAKLLRALSNKTRLLIVCKLLERGEVTAGALVEETGSSQSALSQHLSKLREERIVSYRRDSQTLWYRIADPRVESLMAELYRTFCGRPGSKG